MIIYGLYGKSGTGKSYKSSEVASKHQIEAVIDDGILIMNKIRVAGKSAKNERTMHAATKRAIFFSEAHRREIRNYLDRANIDKLLILGTSQKMVKKIVERLGLPTEIIWIPIESVQSKQELAFARESRGRGYHVIPILPIEVEKTYHGSWFRKLAIRIGLKHEEVTLVKPIYFGGKITVSPQYIRKLVTFHSDRALHIHSVKIEKDKVVISLSIRKGYSIQKIVEWKQQLFSALAYQLGPLYTVEIEWRSIILSK